MTVPSLNIQIVCDIFNLEAVQFFDGVVQCFLSVAEGARNHEPEGGVGGTARGHHTANSL